MSLKEAKKYLNIIRKRHENAEQRKTLANINIRYNARNNAIKFIEDYGSMITPNQMLKRLPIALAQIKAGNNSESLLNEIRQIIYSLYQSKEITKKVYNNIINSIKA